MAVKLITVEKTGKNDIDADEALKIMRKVTIPFAFLFFTGVAKYTGQFAQCLDDFAEKLKWAPSRSIEFHFKRGDFARWIRDVLGDETLAMRINEIDEANYGESLRPIIQATVKERLAELKEVCRFTY